MRAGLQVTTPLWVHPSSAAALPSLHQLMVNDNPAAARSHSVRAAGRESGAPSTGRGPFTVLYVNCVTGWCSCFCPANWDQVQSVLFTQPKITKGLYSCSQFYRSEGVVLKRLVLSKHKMKNPQIFTLLWWTIKKRYFISADDKWYFTYLNSFLFLQLTNQWID